MANKRRLAATIAAMALTAALAVGGTLAYLSNVTESKTNTFSSSRNVNTELTETFDQEEAKNYTPGQVIAKKPVMTNKSDEEVWVAVSLDYTNGGGSIPAAKFAEYAEIQGMNSTDWTKIGTSAEGKELFMYKTTLGKDVATNPIFESIKVKNDILEVKKVGASGTIIYTKDANGNLLDVKDNTQFADSIEYFDAAGNKLTITEGQLQASLPTFEIIVTGYAVQASDVAADIAKIELSKLAGSTLNTTFN